MSDTKIARLDVVDSQGLGVHGGLTNFEADVLLDGDGVPSGDEYVMNTDPTNGLLFLRLT